MVNFCPKTQTRKDEYMRAFYSIKLLVDNISFQFSWNRIFNLWSGIGGASNIWFSSSINIWRSLLTMGSRFWKYGCSWNLFTKNCSKFMISFIRFGKHIIEIKFGEFNASISVSFTVNMSCYHYIMYPSVLFCRGIFTKLCTFDDNLCAISIMSLTAAFI